MKKRIDKCRSFLILAMFVLIFLGMPEHAAAAKRMGSLTIYYHGVTPQGNQAALSGAEFSLHKVGKKEGNEWKLQGAFEASKVNLTDMSSSGQRKAAEQLYDFVVKGKLEGETRTTGKNGRAVFHKLEEGMYLCAATSDITYEDGIFRSAPFLVFVPEIDEKGNCFYDVTVEPKNEWVEEPTNPQKPEQPEKKPENSKGDGVKTGDETPVEQIIKVLAISMIVIILLVFIKNYRKKAEQDDTSE